MYKGDPTLTFGNIGGELGVVANPKSAILGIDPFNKMLAGFMSRWMIP